mgnify:CR=1 FL=1
MNLSFPEIIPRIYQVLKWLIIALVTYFVVDVAWTLTENPVIEITPVSSKKTYKSSASSSHKSINSLLARNLFGQTNKESKTRLTSSTPATQTQLPLTLESVFASQEKLDSTAVISQREQDAKLYRIKDPLPGNAQLIEIYKDRVILFRAGNREVLSFPKSTANFKTFNREIPSNSNNKVTPPNKPNEEIKNNIQPAKLYLKSPSGRFPRPETTAKADQSKTKKNTQSVQDFIGDSNDLSFSDSGGVIIDDSVNSPYLRKTGLQRGDIILSVNGKPAQNVSQSKAELQSLMSQGSARIEIQRGSRRFFITASIPK